MKKEEVPTFVVEEHHEAFIAWNYAIQAGLMPANGNCLFHVDTHSDMGIPRFNRSINDIKGNLDVMKSFTYKELNIGCFIIPACYQGIFDQVFWIKQKNITQMHNPQEMFVRSYNQSGKRLISGKVQNLQNDISDPDRKTFKYFLSSIDQLPSHKRVILDIDLDYFSCSGNPLELQEIVIEITNNEYKGFVENAYHRLNYIGMYNIEAVIRNNKYYYIINKFKEQYPNDIKVENKVVVERINKFIDCLLSKRITPFMIDICRSRFSGYTPCDQWEFIENELLIKLGSIFNLKQIKWN